MLDMTPETKSVLNEDTKTDPKKQIRVVQEYDVLTNETFCTAFGSDVILEGRVAGLSKEVLLKDGVKTTLPPVNEWEE